MERISWESYLNDIQTIHSLSQKFNDNWQMIIGVSFSLCVSLICVLQLGFADVIAFQNDEIGGTYLVKSKTMALNLSENSNGSSSDENQAEFTDSMEHDWRETACESSGNGSRGQPIKFEYHVLYHISYAVPYLCFNAYKSSTASLPIHHIFVRFQFDFPDHLIYRWNATNARRCLGIVEGSHAEPQIRGQKSIEYAEYSNTNGTSHTIQTIFNITPVPNSRSA